jgi:8-oxo-dGTP pyrophosphatase MutT (NUDIX family)
MSDDLAIQLDNIRARGYRPVVVGCLIFADKVLFVYKAKHNLWQLPQGGVETNEQLLGALHRELAEELVMDLALDNQSSIYLGTDSVVFPSRTQGRRELKNERGENIKMMGKKYFFFAVKLVSVALDIAKTEFNDFRWLTYDQAYKLTDEIYQPGKKRITRKALGLLKTKKLLK